MKTIGCCILLLLIIQTCPAFVYSQTPDANVRGRLTDPSGGALEDVQLTAVHEETKSVYRTQSSPDGEYTFSTLAPGTYRFEAELDGFRKYVRTGIRLSIRQSIRLNISMQPGAPDHEVFVYSKTTMVEPDATNAGAVIGNRHINNLPFDNQNFLLLSLLLPGTAPSAQGSPGSVRGEFSVHINGAREDSNNYILDGVFNNDPKLNSAAINPPADAIEEFEILTSTYDAGFGRSSGGQVNIALKSGTNRFHGTAYEYFRNASLNARNFFSNPEDGNPRYQHNQFGFSLGGPVVENRTFFFADYEGRRIRKGITYLTNVPTAQERQGDFSQSIFPAPVDPFTQTPFEGDQIPAYYINEVGRAIANLYPMPNRSAVGLNYVSSPVLRRGEDRFDIRIDHSFTDASKLVSRFSFYDYEIYDPFSGAGFARVPGFGVNIARRAQNFMIGEDHIFSPSLINQFRFAVNRIAFGAYQEQRAGSLNREAGLPELSDNPRDFGLSFIRILGFSPLGDEYNNPQESVTNVFQVADTLHYSVNKHLIKFGFDFRALQQNAFRDVQSRGFLNFTGMITGNSLADLLLGLPTITGGAQLDNPQYLRTGSWNFFVHDGYRLRRNLTLQFGLRYEYNGPPVDLYDRATTYDAVSQSLVRVGQGSIPRGGYHPDRNNWAPRIGLAWVLDADNTMLLRAGYGIYYDQASLAPGEGLYFNQPYYDFKLYYPMEGFPLTLQDPFPSDYPIDIPASALGFDPNLRTPYIQQWNLTFEKQFGTDSLFEVAYVGSKGTKILSARDINQPAPSPDPLNPRPDPQFADIIYLESRGNSSYHSLQTRFHQRLRSGISALLSYTFGKSLDESSTFFSSAGDSNFPQDSFNLSAEKGRSNFDVRHRFSLGYSYDLPIGQGRRFVSGRGVLSSILYGWSTYGIVSLQSGRPFTVSLHPEISNSNTGTSSLGYGAYHDRPDRIGSGELENPGPRQWFDTGAFVQPEYGSFGNSGRNILDGPGYKSISISMIKDTKIREEISLQFRTEFFNAFNHTNFDLPDGFFGSPSFGTINSAQDPRTIQFGLKIIF
ncbi:MAG: carboxypeptidase regulatory-like domain-containing protein [Acidobacteria bacterium]|nr:carboxypeptidase regulatory-like domain-containing protein [Acidobacteriota bacterium]